MKPRLLAVCMVCFAASVAATASEEAELLMAWELAAGALPEDINLTDGQQVTVEARGPQPAGRGPVVRAELTRGNRNEFEWRAQDERVFYKHYEGAELWVGFRLFVAEPGRNTSTCFFQVGPIRDGANRTRGTGHYQLILRGASKTAWTWREFAGWPNIGDQPAGGAPRILNPEHPRQGFATTIAEFSARREESWVVQVKLHAPAALPDDPEGLIRVWLDGRQVFERRGANALPGDYTRVKWGPYIGNSALLAPIIAYYSDLRIARGGGEEGGFVAVAPAEAVSVAPGRFWRRRLDLAGGEVSARALRLPAGWALDASTRELAGPGDTVESDHRLLIEFLGRGGEVLRRQVWQLRSEPGATL